MKIESITITLGGKQNRNEDNTNEQALLMRCGMFKGYYKWHLAKSWLRCTNDDFYRLYGFNWTPPIWMYEKARKYL